MTQFDEYKSGNNWTTFWNFGKVTVRKNDDEVTVWYQFDDCIEIGRTYIHSKQELIDILSVIKKLT